ncbi:hypothetical protein Mapa_013781 [Marchantia paleacea]|nr:hypothetical protein Mapa_013781 [Marchantia paleacea]
MEVRGKVLLRLLLLLLLRLAVLLRCLPRHPKANIHLLLPEKLGPGQSISPHNLFLSPTTRLNPNTHPLPRRQSASSAAHKPSATQQARELSSTHSKIVSKSKLIAHRTLPAIQSTTICTILANISEVVETSDAPCSPNVSAKQLRNARRKERPRTGAETRTLRMPKIPLFHLPHSSLQHVSRAWESEVARQVDGRTREIVFYTSHGRARKVIRKERRRFQTLFGYSGFEIEINSLQFPSVFSPVWQSINSAGTVALNPVRSL